MPLRGYDPDITTCGPLTSSWILGHHGVTMTKQNPKQTPKRNIPVRTNAKAGSWFSDWLKTPPADSPSEWLWGTPH
jgi:hypothetical protein